MIFGYYVLRRSRISHTRLANIGKRQWRAILLGKVLGAIILLPKESSMQLSHW